MGIQIENGMLFFNKMEEKEDHQDIDVSLLDKSDIPGASLNGKSPFILNFTLLKRSLAC